MSEHYDKLAAALKSALPDRTLDALGRDVLFIRRLREVTASLFVWAVVMSRFAPGLPGFKAAGDWFTRLGGKLLWRCPFQKRFKTPHAVKLLARAFERITSRWRAPREHIRHPLRRLVPDIVIVDSTTAQLQDALRPVFKGTGAKTAALLKIILTISAFGGVPLHAVLRAGAENDCKFFPPLDLFAKGTLFLFDRGFFALERLSAIASAGHRYLCPLRRRFNPLVVGASCAPRHVRYALRERPEGVRLRDLLSPDQPVVDSWDLDVIIDGQPGRVVVRPLPKRSPRVARKAKSSATSRTKKRRAPPPAHIAYVTNLPRADWPPKIVRETYRLRWQIELVFKELKQHLNLESIPTKDRHAAQVFVWASLIALAVSRCVFEWLCPPAQQIGLVGRTRRALVSRALESLAIVLGMVLSRCAGSARILRELIVRELEIQASAQPGREDTFRELEQLLAA